MKVLANSSQLEKQVAKLIRNCDSMRWAVAWASHTCPLHKILEKHGEKIEQLTVGIHFYQTHPDFIEAFHDHDAVRFIMNPEGVFHPKVYLFEFGDGKWSGIVGSPNFTLGGFGANCEVAVQIESTDQGAAEAYRQLDAMLTKCHAAGKQLNAKELDAYRAVWKRQLGKRESLAGTYTSPDEKKKLQKPPLEVPVFTNDWHTYLSEIRNDPQDSVEERLFILEEARRLFTTHNHFNDIPEDYRKCIAGLIKGRSPDWGYFGGMTGNGDYRGAVYKNNSFISQALDVIPLSGEISKRYYEKYCTLLKRAYARVGTATATRLLAMKRPDYFVCLDGKNEKKLRHDFGISKKVMLDEYWDKVVARLTDSNWWDSDEPTDPFERRIWQCRAAFLDVKYYEPE